MPGDEAAKPIVLKVLLRQRHLQSFTSFTREYDRTAERVDKALKGHAPSKAQYYRWLSGELVGLPYSDHCLILEAMFPGWKVAQLFEVHQGGIEFVPEPPSASNVEAKVASSPAAENLQDLNRTTVYPHRHAVPKELWGDLLDRATSDIEILVYVGMCLLDDRRIIEKLTRKAKSGARVRLLFGDMNSTAISRRSVEENIGKSTITAKIRQAMSFFQPLAEVDGIDIRTHGTTLYNSIYRYDDDMIVNPHVYGFQAPHAPALHLHRVSTNDLFDTYAESFEGSCSAVSEAPMAGRVWDGGRHLR